MVIAEKLTYDERVKLEIVLGFFIDFYESDVVTKMVFDPDVTPDEVELKMRELLTCGKISGTI